MARIALGGGLEHVLGDTLLPVVDGHGAVEGDAHPDRTAGQGPRDTVAIAADLDVGVPADLAGLPVRRVVAPGWQRLQGRGFRVKRSATTSCTVPCTRGSASSRSHCSAS